MSAIPSTFTPGQIWVENDAVRINTDNDGSAQYTLFVIRRPSQAQLPASDFIL